jgi:hypothetical protein
LGIWTPVQFFESTVHCADAGSKILRPSRHVALQSKDFAIDGQAVVKAFPDYSEDPIDRGTIVHLLCLESFDTVRKSSRIAVVEAGFDAFLYLGNASLD